jgi:hypothetical protein
MHVTCAIYLRDTASNTMSSAAPAGSGSGLGFCRNYSFNTGDLTTCGDVLINYLEAYEHIPWDDLRFVSMTVLDFWALHALVLVSAFGVECFDQHKYRLLRSGPKRACVLSCACRCLGRSSMVATSRMAWTGVAAQLTCR